MVERRSHTTEFRDQTASPSLEVDAFGAPKWKPPYNPQESQDYLPYQDSLQAVRENYDLDPENPPTPLARDLRLAIVNRLNLSQESTATARFYSAIGTQLDHHHGIDAFIDIVKDGTIIKTITLDATLSPQKQTTGHKADIIIGDLPEVGGEEWWKMINKTLTRASF